MRYFMMAMLAPLAACSIGWSEDDGSGAAASGTGSTRTFAVSDFSAIDLRGSDDVDVRVGAGFSVRAEGPSDVLDTLRIERDGSTLKVGRRDGTHFAWGKGKSVKVFVTLPRLAAAAVSGSGSMTVDRVEGAAFKGGIAGSGGLDVAALAVDDAELSIAGLGDLQAAGTARRIDLSIAGSGDIAARGLKAQSAAVSIAGSGSATAAVVGPAKVSIMGSGDVDLGPQARCTVSKMGSGSVRCAS